MQPVHVVCIEKQNISLQTSNRRTSEQNAKFAEQNYTNAYFDLVLNYELVIKCFIIYSFLRDKAGVWFYNIVKDNGIVLVHNKR